MEKTEPKKHSFDAFKLWCWRKLLRVPGTERRSDQSILKESNPEYSLEGLMLKLQSFGHLIWTADSLEKTLMLGKIEGKIKGQQRMKWLNSITASMNMNLSKLQKIVEDREGWHAAVHGVTKIQTWLRDWTTMTCVHAKLLCLCLTLWDSRDCSTPGPLVLHQIPEPSQIHIHWISDAI